LNFGGPSPDPSLASLEQSPPFAPFAPATSWLKPSI
jgi:hypothetical protein